MLHTCYARICMLVLLLKLPSATMALRQYGISRSRTLLDALLLQCSLGKTPCPWQDAMFPHWPFCLLHTSGFIVVKHSERPCCVLLFERRFAALVAPMGLCLLLSDGLLARQTWRRCRSSERMMTHTTRSRPWSNGVPLGIGLSWIPPPRPVWPSKHGVSAGVPSLRASVSGPVRHRTRRKLTWPGRRCIGRRGL